MLETNSKLDTAQGCRACREALPDLLLDPAAVSPASREHMASCAPCAAELASLRATLSAMDAWTAPEPSAFFDTRLHARLREQIATEPAGWMERLRAYFQFSTGRQLRPALAGALALVLLVSGGTFAGIHELHTAAPTPAVQSATVNDLKILDNNDQALQQMDQLLDDSNGQDMGAPTS